MNYLNIARNLGVEYNVTFRVLDESTKKVVSEHVGHNQATNTMMTGIAHYLKGDGILNQGESMLGTFIPRYISLGTMGLLNQDQTENGLPAGIGVTPQQEGESDEDFEVRRYKEYMEQLPGYGADGYSSAQNNGREYFGLGPMFSVSAVKCELITPAYPRAPITYRAVLPESESELPETMDIIFSAYISTGSLAKFRGNNDYLFITEVGMWGSRTYKNTSENGLLAAYRIVPPNSENYDMENPANRSILQQNILRVGRNQIVQVIWKIQLGSVEQFGGYVEAYRRLLEYIENLENSGRIVRNIELAAVIAASGTAETVERVTLGSVDLMQEPYASKWQQGNSDSYGRPVSSTTRLICYEGLVPVPQNAHSLSVSCSATGGRELKFWWDGFSAQNYNSFVGSLYEDSWQQSGNVTPIRPNVQYLSFLALFPDQATIVPADLMTYTVTFYE
jgi:hypothetical protein